MREIDHCLKLPITSLETSYFSLLILHDVKIIQNFDEIFITNPRDSFNILNLLNQPLVNSSCFYVQMTNKMHY